MTDSESLQQRLDRVRAPRVRITYDVETGGAIETKELPFVVGVLADLSGKPKEALPRLRERRFVEVDRDSLDSVLSGMKPRLAFTVDNRLLGDGSRLPVEIEFSSLEDFHPERVAQQVEPLRRLLEARRRLSDLLDRLEGNDRLEELLKKLAASPETLQLAGEPGDPEDGQRRES